MNAEPSSKLNWLVTGPGAISGLIAAGLLEQQQSVHWLTRTAAQHTCIDWSLTKGSSCQHYQTPVFSAGQRIDAVILAVKSYDLSNALQRLDQLNIDANCPVIISHNGMSDIASKRPLFALLTTQAASRDGYAITKNGDGESWLAQSAVNQQQLLPDTIQQLLKTAFAPLSVVEDIQRRQWQKLLINCVINPLTAIYRVNNGALAESRFRAEKDALIEEFIAVAAAEGQDIDFDSAQQRVDAVINATAKNRSSMLVDVDNQRPTEIYAMNGFIVEKAGQHGLSVPLHKKVTCALGASYLSSIKSTTSRPNPDNAE
ncbi:ketopantoate reductase [Idiomarina aquatica]|uniref:2-dehydropantoate 2-reductase n=1 Tax=Idiomarina aquatica TaxID=1327752 RepID=A0A4R6NYT0_9GAMM|nr:2-dehydropantoate 2-reductase [Idiomarina aquatica]TDP29930.1 ketopantoate reductase [Idiomarina aquatica]